MKTKSKNKKFDAVWFMRRERDKISKEIANMSHDEIKEYFARRRGKDRVPKNE